MRHIVIDLEMNVIDKEYKKEKEFCSMEVIQIGAILLDESYMEIGQFQTLVKPQYNDVIRKNIASLTGISTEMVEDAPVFEDALHSFLSWCKTQGDVQVYAWSESDRDQLLHEINLKGIAIGDEEIGIINDFIDFQNDFDHIMGLERSISLENALMYAGVDFAGHQHDALDDARNTADLLRIVNTPSLRAALEKSIDAMKPKSIGATMGDLFRFANLQID